MTVLRDLLLIVSLSALLAWAGAVPVVDHMTHTVLGIVDPIAWGDVWRPYWNPPPMNVAGVRPGSVLLMKVFALGFSNEALPNPCALGVLAALQLAAFGIGAWAWLRSLSLGSVALPATAASLVLSPTLFSAWYLPELDALGAGLTLGGLALLGRREPLGSRWLLCLLLLGTGVFLKESSGLIALGLLLAGGAAAALRRDRRQVLRHGLIAGAAGLGWLLLSLPLLGDTSSAMASTGPLARLGVVEHNAVQLVSLVGAAGVGLLALGARLRWAHWLAPAVVAALVVLPELRFYNHYEAVYATKRWTAALLAAVLLVSLLLRRRERGRPGLVAIALAPAAVYGVLTVAALVLSTAREDMASRILLATAPALFGLAFDAGRQAWIRSGTAPPSHRRRVRTATGLLLMGCCWTSLAGGVNAVLDWRARHAVDHASRSALVERLQPRSLVLFNHYWMWLGAVELQAAGADAAILDTTTLALVPSRLTKPVLPTVDWGAGPLDLQAAVDTGQPTSLYWLSARSLLPVAQRQQLAGDLSWTRRPLGMFTPLRPPSETSSSLPAHNFPEDLHLTEWATHVDETGTLDEGGLLAAALQQPGASVTRIEHTAPRLATDLLDLPRRALLGLPLVEPRIWIGRLVGPPTN